MEQVNVYMVEVKCGDDMVLMFPVVVNPHVGDVLSQAFAAVVEEIIREHEDEILAWCPAADVYEWYINGAEVGRRMRSRQYDGPLYMDEEMEELSVEQLLHDYALWVGVSAVEGQQPEYMVPKVYLGELMEAGDWYIARARAEEFLRMFYKDRPDAWFAHTLDEIVWSDEDDGM